MVGGSLSVAVGGGGASVVDGGTGDGRTASLGAVGYAAGGIVTGAAASDAAGADSWVLSAPAVTRAAAPDVPATARQATPIQAGTR